MKNLTLKLLSFIASYVVYYYLFGINIATILMITITIHEYGHLCMANIYEIENNGFFYIPFVGGMTSIKGVHLTNYEKFILYWGGPAFGFLGSVFGYLLFFITREKTFLDATLIMLILNCFNIIPFVQLDGGEMLKCLVFNLQTRTKTLIFSLPIILLIIFNAIVFHNVWIWILLIFVSYKLYDNHINNYYDYYCSKMKKQNMQLSLQLYFMLIAGYVFMLSALIFQYYSFK